MRDEVRDEMMPENSHQLWGDISMRDGPIFNDAVTTEIDALTLLDARPSLERYDARI